MRAEKPPVSFRKIAADLDVSLGTVQDIVRSLRARGKAEEAHDCGGHPDR
jgi:transposase